MSDPVADSVTLSAADSTQLQQLYAEIDQFEQQLAERVAAGYAVVGPGRPSRFLRDGHSRMNCRIDHLAD